MPIPQLPPIQLTEQTKQRLEAGFRAYWLSPFCAGTIEIGEPIIAWALGASHLGTKAFADAYNIQTKVAYQIKTGLVNSPVTFARLTTPSQSQLVNSDHQADRDRLGAELLAWVHARINEPKALLGAEQVRVARIIYTQIGSFTYYERDTAHDPYDPSQFSWIWSTKGNALEGYYENKKWFSWYPQGRLQTKNQNQLHFHGENAFIPPAGAANRHDFYLGKFGRITFDDFMKAMLPIVNTLSNDS